MRRVTHSGEPRIEASGVLGLHESASTLRYVNARYFEFERKLSYPQTSGAGAWKHWRQGMRRMMRQTFKLDALGDVPTPRPQVLETSQQEGYQRHKIAYETLPGNWVRAYLLVPDGGPQRKPAVICPHGHVPGLKQAVAIADPESKFGVAYAHEFARRGLIALAPDNAGQGERAPGPEHEHTAPSPCFQLWCRLNHMGLDLTGLRVFDLLAGLNMLQARDDVRPNRIGAAGLSGGCWLSQVLTAMDRRIRAVILSGFFTTFPQTVWHGHCICHHPLGIGRFCDMPDISALIAPRPQFVESGTQDRKYPFQPAFEMTRRAYELLGRPQRIDAHRYEGGHLFHGGKSIPWMQRQLGGR